MPRLSAEKKEYIELNFQDKTLKELASHLGCSESTISRNIKLIRDADNSSSATASATDVPVTVTSTGGVEAGDTQPPEPQLDSYQYTPVNDAEHELIELPRDTADGGLQTLLRSHTIVDENDEDNLYQFNEPSQAADTDGGAQQTEGGAEAPPQAPIDSAQIDPSEYDAILQGLLGNQPNESVESFVEEPPRTSGRKKRGVTKAAVCADDTNKELPLVVLRTKIRLFLKQFPQVIEELAGTNHTDQERFKRSIVKMDRHELNETIACIQSVLTLESGVNMIRSTVYMGASASEQIAPMLGGRLEGFTSALMEQRQQLDDLAALWTIDHYDFVANRLTAESQLFMLITSTAARVHNTNSLMDLNVRQHQSTESINSPVSDDTADRYKTL